ncbi:metallophosphoesterase family protein [Halopseudomonas salegens]|uniref:PhoD-like phosphatase n=1 Tax=Halopseudomonas salegens TaxID=1434072 RepID=A0A1H2HFA3_9GAMM|nr:hypothetical protein [Halopseudomonas salegens]SDU30476.1 hypothetical protein SAMN05216210_2998 [Halopseudomonas salegens]
MPDSADTLPPLLTGPILRRCSADRLAIWMVVSEPLALTLKLQPMGEPEREVPLADYCDFLPIGRYANILLIDVPLATPLPLDTPIEYDLAWSREGHQHSLLEAMPYLRHPDQQRPSFVVSTSNRRLLHGSCRKPHHDSADALVQADRGLGERLAQAGERPNWLLMTGDQVYADDVAGPMLVAIHRLIERLGLFDETLEGATVVDSQALFKTEHSYYQRAVLLPDVAANRPLRERFFGGASKPVFTSVHAHNHLVTLAEVLAMYLLVWSPECWRLIAPEMPSGLTLEHQQNYRREEVQISRFVDGLPQVARLLAHLPSLMIFDDHDITDDWNLTADWETAAYGHPFSRRIIGNALLAYLLCQAWGNDPDRVATPLGNLRSLLQVTAQSNWLPAEQQDICIDNVLAFQGWEYQIPGTPLLLVLDTRTRRWRSERSPSRPSGLMDWEALCELQQHLIGQSAVVVVTPAPMFGVKLIEGIQKLFTLIGQPLLVDAENWMAHRGAARVMLNIFRHSHTPANYVMLSGDVHYSFVYDIHIRDQRTGPNIWQITSSGLKNTFPTTLLDWFDRLDRWLYAPWSPLNWLTKRRRMLILPRDPDRASAGERLWNGSGIGWVQLDGDGRPEQICQLDARDFAVDFIPHADARQIPRSH